MTDKISLTGMIGNTPLVYLREVSEATGCDIFGKAEFLNPGGSVKDRTALGIIRDAEQRGELEPGGTIVEGTAGNTGIGLSLIANALGYRCVVVMPQTQSKEKIELLDLYGADLRLVNGTTYDDPNHYIHVADRLSKELASTSEHGVIWARQFDNLANMQIHYDGTGQEIWQQTDGKVDGFVCAAGTGGTLAGVSTALKEKNPDVQIALADPMGSSLYHYYRDGELRGEGRTIMEGIGLGLLTDNLKQAKVDHAFQITDEQALPYIYKLLRNEGLCMGGSSGINIAGAVKLAEEMGPGHTIVTVLCDYGNRYQSKLFNPAFLQRMKLPVPDWLNS